MTETTYEPVDVAEVRKDDEVKVRGEGRLWGADDTKAYFDALFWYPVKGSLLGNIEVMTNDYWWTVARTSIVAARRRVEVKEEGKVSTCGAQPMGVFPRCILSADHTGVHVSSWPITPPAPPKQEAEPEVKPGTWRHGGSCINRGKVMTDDYIEMGALRDCSCPEVRRSTGWSQDQRVNERRKGAPWIVKFNEKLPVNLNGFLKSRRKSDRRKVTR